MNPIERIYRILQLIGQVLGLYRRMEDLKDPQSPETVPPSVAVPKDDLPATEAPQPRTAPPATQRIYAAAFSVIGRDLSTIADNDVACAESVTRGVLKPVYPDTPIILNTHDLDRYFRSHPLRFRPTATPELGCLTVFPTTNGIVGHCGVWGKTHVMSNTSATGRWEANYTHAEWYAAAKKRGLKVYHYIPL